MKWRSVEYRDNSVEYERGERIERAAVHNGGKDRYILKWWSLNQLYLPIYLFWRELYLQSTLFTYLLVLIFIRRYTTSYASDHQDGQ